MIAPRPIRTGSPPEMIMVFGADDRLVLDGQAEAGLRTAMAGSHRIPDAAPGRHVALRAPPALIGHRNGQAPTDSARFRGVRGRSSLET
jgi:hypothetical protein